MNLHRLALTSALIVGFNVAPSEASSVSYLFGTQACGQQTTATGTCDSGVNIFSWQAFGDSSTLRLAMDFNNTGPGFPFDGGHGTLVGGGVTVNDLVTITGGSAGSSGTVQFAWHVDGQLTVNGAPYYSTVGLDQAVNAEWRACGASVAACSGFSSAANETVIVSMPFTFGTPLATIFTLRGGTSGGAVSFYNTAALQPLFVFDSTGSQVAASVVSDDGTRYTVAQIAPTAVPEPGTLFLFSIGGAALLVYRPRRRSD